LKSLLFLILILIFTISCSDIPEPKPYGPVPSEHQLKWQEMEFYGFIHFGPNTFLDMEWGYGDADPKDFNPTELNCEQWAKVAKEAGMKGLILTAKHHDGFCLWPSKYTDFSIAASDWKNGNGDVVQEFVDACEKYGLKAGLYLSPWDRNHSKYGSPEYLQYFRNQLEEIMTNYGDLFEAWFDGANGGSGYYGGADEERHIDRKTYYDWESTWQIVRKHQPNAVIFSDAGPDVRWIGNEEGWANKTNWSLLRRDEVWVGWPHYKQLRSGHEDGTHWVPAEVDVSIRPGWFYHTSQDDKVKTLPHLLDIYYHSVGRNGNFLLNLPVDKRGLIHENDAAQLIKLGQTIRSDFASDLASNAKITATNIRGNSKKFSPKKLVDDNKNSYWATDDNIKKASITIDFQKKILFNRLLLQEHIKLGQRVKKFSVEVLQDNKWLEIAMETTIGYKRILRFPAVETDQVRINFLDTKAELVIQKLGIYNAQTIITNPSINRDKDGKVSLDCEITGPVIYYSTDGSIPNEKSHRYYAPFTLQKKGKVKAIAIGEDGKKSDIISKAYDISKAKWKIKYADNFLQGFEPEKAIDTDPNTFWHTDWNNKDINHPHEIQIDLGENVNLKGFTYLPRQDGLKGGIVFRYNFYTSIDGNNWKKISDNREFSNIFNDSKLREVHFVQKHDARFIRFQAISGKENEFFTSVGEIGIITK